jgi:hypothetical protein
MVEKAGQVSLLGRGVNPIKPTACHRRWLAIVACQGEQVAVTASQLWCGTPPSFGFVVACQRRSASDERVAEPEGFFSMSITVY